jgi:hypothetical protein
MTPTVPPTGADANEFYWMSAPLAVPLGVTNRAGNEIAPVVCRSFVGSSPRAMVTGCSPTAKAATRVALLVWRNGVRTFVAAPRDRTSQSCFIGALAAAPGSMAMLRASPTGFPSRELHGFERVCPAASFFDERPSRHAVESSPIIGQVSACKAKAPLN